MSSGFRRVRNTGMAQRRRRVHIAVAEALDGKTVDWMEKVSDTQFNG